MTVFSFSSAMSFFQLPRIFLFLLVSAATFTPGWAQTDRPISRQFQWQFTNDGLGASLPTCLALGIRVKSWDVTLNNTFGIAPYYMISYPIGGTPLTTFIGTNNQSLSWTATHSAGSKLLLNVVDSTGSSGGIPPRLFDVIAGQTTQCVTAPLTTPEFSLTSNVTGNLETCQPWGVTIKGGVPPYNVSILAVNSPVVTNLTIPSGFDTFTYIDRADPDGQMIMAVSDLTGRWASGTPIVNTKGSKNTDCTGLVSSSGDSKSIKKEEDAKAKSAKRKRDSIIIGVCVTLGVLLLAGIGVGIFFYLRKRRIGEGKHLISDLQPRQFPKEASGGMASLNGYIGSTSRLGSGGSKGQLPPLPPSEGPYNPYPPATSASILQPASYYSNTANTAAHVATYESSASEGASSDHRGGTEPVVRPSFARFPATLIRNSGKAAEATMPSSYSPDSEYPATSSSLSRSASHVLGRSISSTHSLTGTRVTNPRGPRVPSVRRTSDEAAVRDEIIIQHRDGGLVKELPPPYADRTRLT